MVWGGGRGGCLVARVRREAPKGAGGVLLKYYMILSYRYYHHINTFKYYRLSYKYCQGAGGDLLQWKS